MIHSIVAALLALCFATSGALAYYGWRFRSKPIVKLFLCLMACYIQTSIVGIMILSAPGFEEKVFFSRFKYVGLALQTPFYLLLVIEIFQFFQTWPRKLLYPVVLSIPLVVVVLNIVPDLQNYFVHSFTPFVSHGLAVVSFSNGPFFPYYVGFTYILQTIGISLVVRILFRGSQLQKKQAKVILCSVSLPIAADILAILFQFPTRWFLLSIGMQCFIALGIAIAVFRGRLMDLTHLLKWRAFDDVPEAILVFDSAQRLQEYNTTASRLFALNQSHIGMPMQSSLPALLTETVVKASAKPELSYEVRLPSSPAFESTYDLRAKVLHQLGKEPVGYLISLHDLSRQKALEEELRSINLFKAKLLSLISHDLSGNLNSLSALASNLREHLHEASFHDPRLRRSLDLLVESALVTQEFLSNTLSWTKTREISFEPKRIPFELRQLVEECIEAFSPQARAKNISIRVKEYTGPLIVEGDSEMISMIIRNLLSNAIKFTRENGHVQILLTRDEHELSLAVQDDGPGMTPDQIQSIQEHRAPERGYGDGFGIGLKICAELIETHKGRLWAQSASGQGSTVGFKLPL